MMDNGNMNAAGSASQQTSATPTTTQKGELPTIETSQSIAQMKLPNDSQQQQQNPQQQEPQQGGYGTNMTQPSMQMRPQSDNQPIKPDTMVSQQDHNANQQNLAGGQASINWPPQQQQQQQQQQPPLPVQQQQQPHHPSIKPLLADEPKGDVAVDIVPNQQGKQESPQRTIITKVKLSDELNIFDWFRTTDIIHQIAEKAKSSVDSVITTLDPGMREYLYSGGNINIVVISDSQRLVAPIRDSFQDVFGRATVVGARYNSPSMIIDYPIRTACGFAEATQVAREKVKKLRSDTSSIPQNQVVVVVQSTLVNIKNDIQTTQNPTEIVQSEWFLTYCMLIEDPVLGVTMNTFGQLIPMDQDVIDGAKTSRYPETFQDKHLGFTVSIDELMAAKLRLSLEEMSGDEYGNLWLPRWAGVYEMQLIRQLSLTLANSYRRKWNECASIETVVS